MDFYTQSALNLNERGERDSGVVRFSLSLCLLGTTNYQLAIGHAIPNNYNSR